jgi:hypothetical protein
MIRHIAIAGFALVVATSAQAITPAPLLQQDSVIKVAAGCGVGRTMVNGKCQARVEKRHERRQERRGGGQPATTTGTPPAGTTK